MSSFDLHRACISRPFLRGISYLEKMFRGGQVSSMPLLHFIMFKFFKRNSSNGNGKAHGPQFADINGIPLQEGDLVESLRYELGKCRIHALDQGYEYESLSTGQRVSYLRMVDAATSYQKVRKLEETPS